MIATRYHSWLQTGRPADLDEELQPLLPSLHAQASHVLGNATDADDVVQEVCVTLLVSREKLPVSVPLAAIARRLTGQRALMVARARQRRWRRFGPLSG